MSKGISYQLKIIRPCRIFVKGTAFITMNYGKYGTRKRQRALTSKTTKLKKMILVTMLKAILVCFITTIVLGISLVLGMFRGILNSTPDISIEDVIPTSYASVVYDSEGHEMVKLVEEGSNRSPVTMDLIPDDLAHAFVAIEDQRFYQHNGIDIKGILRAGFTGLKNGGHFTSGASTITQQLLKNNVFDGWVTERTFIERLKRKIQEQYLAIQLEKYMDKDQILEYYMNTINLGHSTLGVQAASQRYFDKPVYELTLSECAVIAGITQNPSQYDPIIYPEENAGRRKDVLDRMLEQEWISQAEYDEAMADDVYSRIQAVNQNIIDSSVYTYFEDALVSQLERDLQEKAGYSPTQAKNLLYSGGLSIYSTQDRTIQAMADEVCSNPENYPENVRYELSYQLTIEKPDGSYENFGSESFTAYFKESDRNFKMLYSSEEEAYTAIETYKQAVMSPGDTFVSETISLTPQPQISMTIMDQYTGHVLAMVGGRGQKEGSRTLNRAFSVQRQPGSTFKIIAAYAPALDTGMKTLASVYNDAPFNYDDGTPVQNYDRKYHGLLSIRDGILGSINVLAAKTITEITPALGFSYTQNFGFSTLVESAPNSDGTKVLSDVTQSLSLGGLTTGVKNYELCAAYATIANNGTYLEPILYTKVIDSHGNVILDNTVNQESHQVIKETTAYLLTNAMEDVLTGGGSGIVSPTGTAANFTGQALAGKTGTSTAYRDVWFAGFSPYYTCAVWTGYDNRNSTTFLSGSERNLSKNLWRLVMTKIHENLPYQAFTMPSGITTCTVCSRSGKLPIAGLCDNTLKTEYFENGTQPTELCDVHYSGSVCCVDVLPASENCPFQIEGILELLPVEHESLLRGSTMVNADGTVTTASTTNMCQHTAEFFALPDSDALLLQQWANVLPEQQQAILDTSPSDYFRNLIGYGTQPPVPDTGGEVIPILPPDGTSPDAGGGTGGSGTDNGGGGTTGGTGTESGSGGAVSGGAGAAGGAAGDSGGAGTTGSGTGQLPNGT